MSSSGPEHDARSQLEREFDVNLGRIVGEQWLPPKYITLINILKAERDAWRYNFQQSEKDRQKLLEKVKLLEGAINILRD